MPGKIGPKPERGGSQLYPGFSNTVPPGFSRLGRIEKGSQRLQRGTLRPTSGNYTRLPINVLTGKPSNQVISVSNPMLKKIGGVSIHASNGPFAYTSTTSSISWYWDGTNGSTVPVIQRADGTRFTVPTGGSPITITGLAANTTYYFLPFWNVSNLCNIGWVPGTVGSPLIAFILSDTTSTSMSSYYLLEQTTQSNEPLTASYMSAATTMSGSGGGTGGPPGGHGCVMSGTDIVTVGNLPHTIEVLKEAQWIRIQIEDGRVLYCTHDHPLYDAIDGKIDAECLKSGDLVITDVGEQRIIQTDWVTRLCSKHKVHMEKGHLYFANGMLSHNVKPFPPNG